MQRQLPEVVDFLKQVDKNSCFEGSWPLSRLDRLRQLVSSDEGDLIASVRFSKRSGLRCLDGTVSAQLVLECQRCLQPLTKNIQSEFHLALVASEEEAADLPKEFEPLDLVPGEQSLIDVLEDELLLSLPIVALHDRDCSDDLHRKDEQETASGDTYKPFAGLRDLMN
jgi:uncharacterized protein